MKIDEKLLDSITFVFEVIVTLHILIPTRNMINQMGGWVQYLPWYCLCMASYIDKVSQGQVKKRWDNWSCRVKIFKIFVFWRIDVFFNYNVSLIVLIFTWSINKEKVLRCAPVNVWVGEMFTMFTRNYKVNPITRTISYVWTALYTINVNII